MPAIAMGSPAGASSNMPIGGSPARTINSLITMLVEVLISVTELVRIEAKARGSSRREGLVLLCAAMPSTTGTKKAVAAVLLMKADSVATEIMMMASRKSGRLPAWPSIHRPTVSTMPVWERAAVMMKKPRIIITVLLPKPAKA